jgi:membrane protein DedA with SNARE-associated domain
LLKAWKRDGIFNFRVYVTIYKHCLVFLLPLPSYAIIVAAPIAATAPRLTSSLPVFVVTISDLSAIRAGGKRRVR